MKVNPTEKKAPESQQPLVPVDPFEPEYLKSIVENVFAPLAEHYFRPRLLGAHRLPQDGPAILAGNHSGTAFPYDAMMLDCLLWQRCGLDPAKKCRSVYEKELSSTWWMRPFGIDNFWRRGGGVDMTFDNFDRLLERGDRILYYPEGVPGIGKGFFKRYQLQRFSSSFIILAAKHQAPVYPIYIINAEWVIPFNFTLKWIDRLTQRHFGVPFLPLPAAPLVLLFPWMWYLALPARMVFRVGKPFDVADMVRRAGVRIDELDQIGPADREILRGVADEVRGRMQERLSRHVERYGRWPYQGRSLWRQLKRARRLTRVFPWSWPWIFVRHERDRDRPPARNQLHSWLRDWDLAGYYLPLGWIVLALARKFRRPPYGYRGLTSRESKRVQGCFHWHLRERPLPPRADERIGVLRQ